jgi:hypothetical protein
MDELLVKMLLSLGAAGAIATGVVLSAEEVQERGAEIEAQFVQVFEDYQKATDELLAGYRQEEE